MLAVLVLTVGSYLSILPRRPMFQDLQDALKATTVIYDKEGNQAGSLSGQKGLMWSWMLLVIALENAVIATEDRTFYKNSGVNVKRFLWLLCPWGALVVVQPLPNSWLKMPS